MRCRYCHNPGLVLPSNENNSFTEDDIFELLKKRKHLIEGVTISGGEPTLNRDLDEFIAKIKLLGFAVKLDTNGLKPEVIAHLISGNLLDYVAVDVKTSPDKYRNLTGKDVNFSTIVDTINILRESGIKYEVRTTCVPDYVTIEDFHAIKESIGYVHRYQLQQFVPDHNLIDNNLRSLQPYPVKVLFEFQKFVQTFSDNCEIRGI